MLTEEEKNAGLEGKIIPINIEEQMKSAYIDYSMSVIVSRALPDVRDGLKPVHRRILYDMSAELNLYSDKPTRKSARIVGDVLGKFHPHGDSSVYEAMVRMAQDWSMRYPLVEGQGNFGSMDGDSAAAMRYTEARMQKITDEVMADIDKETIDWTTNFDDTLKEPTVLPTKIPLLLVNGSSGIAVGMATNMAPHNLGEVVDACCAYIDNPDCACEDLLRYVKGPDFPTGALIYGYEGVKEALLTGRGRVIMRARTEIEHTPSGRECIIVTEIPYMVNKAEMIKKIGDLVNEKKIEGISYINDESDRSGMRITIFLKHDASANVVLNTLFKNTQLQMSFAVNNIALVNGRPMLLNLKDLIHYFVEHRHDVVVRRTRFDLKKAQERLHIVQGLLIAQDNIDEVVHIIRSSKNIDEAKSTLMERFGLSDIQASAIVDMRLRALTGLEHDKLEAERKDLESQIAYLTEVLGSVDKQMQIIKDELLEIKEKYGDERRTRILPFSGEMNVEDLIAEENVVVTVTHSGFIKRTKADEYRAQHRGGKGIKGAKLREDDVVDHFFLTSTHNWLLFFTNKGRVYRLKAYELPEGSRDSKGQHVANLLQFGPDETIQTVLSIPNYDVAKYLVLATRSGKVKKTALAEYDSPRQGGLIAVRLMTDENGENADELIGAALCNADDDIILVSKQGMSLKFEANDEQLRPMGRQTAGVQGMKFRDGDELLAMDVVQGDSDRDLLVVTNEGFAKRTAISEYRLQGRNGYGVKAVQLAEGRGSLVGAVIVEESDQIMAIMKSGKVIRSNVAEVKRTGRTTQGVTLAKPDKNDEIISIARNEETDEDDAEQAAAENGAVQNDAAAQSQAETTTENSAETGTEATSDAGDGENVEA